MAASERYEAAVSVETVFVAEQSDIEQNRYVFSYTVTITNIGSIAAQLISRHWVITDATQQVKEVRGLGVVGAQPLIKPGDHYRYTSGCVLDTPEGTMRGSYQMAAEDGTSFEAVIESFRLSMPRVLH